MRVSVLASGSSGNCAIVEARGATILIDAGISARVVRSRFRRLHGQSLRRVDAVFVTHAHGDHARFADVLQRSFDAALHITQPTGKGWGLLERPGVTIFSSDRPVEIGPVTVVPFPLSHDEPQVGLRISDEESALAIATDLGKPSERLLQYLSGCEIVLLEANHDPEMLRAGPYPPELKLRIASDQGHLSNHQAAEILASLPHGTEDVVLMHLSEKNNLPALAREAARQALLGRGIRVHVATQREPLCVGSLPAIQLELGIP